MKRKRPGEERSHRGNLCSIPAPSTSTSPEALILLLNGAPDSEAPPSSYASSPSYVRQGDEAVRGAWCVSVYPRSFVAVVFAPELPPRRKNPASSTGSQHAILGFLKRRGGDSNPRYRLRGITVFEGSILGPMGGI